VIETEFFFQLLMWTSRLCCEGAQGAGTDRGSATLTLGYSASGRMRPKAAVAAYIDTSSIATGASLFSELARKWWHAPPVPALSLHRRDDATHKHLQFARWAKLPRQPLELGLDRRRLRIAQKNRKQWNTRAQAAQADAHLVHALGITLEQRSLVADYLVQASVTNDLESVACACVGGQIDMASRDRGLLLNVDDLVAPFQFALDRNSRRKNVNQLTRDRE
jgi:hypothetical protein